MIKNVEPRYKIEIHVQINPNKVLVHHVNYSGDYTPRAEVELLVRRWKKVGAVGICVDLRSGVTAAVPFSMVEIITVHYNGVQEVYHA